MFVCSDGKKLRLVSALDHVALSGRMAFSFEPSKTQDQMPAATYQNRGRIHRWIHHDLLAWAFHPASLSTAQLLVRFLKS
jgi:hypothetical protein